MAKIIAIIAEKNTYTAVFITGEISILKLTTEGTWFNLSYLRSMREVKYWRAWHSWFV